TRRLENVYSTLRAEMRCIKHSGSTKLSCYPNMPSRPDFQDRGFSLLELIIVVVIILIVAAISVPSINRAISTGRVRSAAVEYSNLLQTAHSRAIRDYRNYSYYVQPVESIITHILYDG